MLVLAFSFFFASCVPEEEVVTPPDTSPTLEDPQGGILSQAFYINKSTLKNVCVSSHITKKRLFKRICGLKVTKLQMAPFYFH